MSRTPKPRLTSGQQVHLDTSSALSRARLGTATPPIHTPVANSPWVAVRRAATTTVRCLVIAAVLIAIIYALLAATVLVVLRADSHHAVVLRGAHPVGQVPSGEVVYASADPVINDASTNLAQAVQGVRGGSVVQVLAGPNAEIATDEQGRLLVNGQVSDYRVQVDAHRLAREYVAVCLTGACTPGQAVLIGQQDVVGAVQGYLSARGLAQPDTAETGQP